MLFLLSLLAAVVAFAAARSLARRPGGQGAGGLVLAGLVFSLIALSRAVTVVPAGHVGVVDLFGWVSERSLPAGVSVVNPLARVRLFSVKTQELKEAMEVPSKEGLSMQVEASLLYHLDPQKAPEVYKTVGVDYSGVLVEPQFRSVTRSVTAAYEARALYTAERDTVARLIAEDLRQQVGPRGIVVESTPLRKLTLPPRLAAAIEQKLESEQESQRMQFVLEKERQEAERKRIEARGVADFQRIVSEGLTEPMLRWKGVEATLRLAESQNSKVVVVGSGKDGLPLILGGQ